MAAHRDKGDIEEGEEASVEWRVPGSAIRAVGAMPVLVCGTHEEVVDGVPKEAKGLEATVAETVTSSKVPNNMDADLGGDISSFIASVAHTV